jgi:hypothetical protein
LLQNTLIIMTSNVGSSVIERGGGGLGFQLNTEESEEERSYGRIKTLVRSLPSLLRCARRPLCTEVPCKNQYLLFSSSLHKPSDAVLPAGRRGNETMPAS